MSEKKGLAAASDVTVDGETVFFFVGGKRAFSIDFADLTAISARPFGQVVIQLGMRAREVVIAS